MRILIACEFSGIVRDAFIAKGHDAVSCDLLPTERPGPHIQGDVLEVLGDGWDMMIAHPPCTHLAVSGARWFKDKIREQEDAITFFIILVTYAYIPKIVVENPIGIMSTHFRKPDQIVQPWMFGHGETKATCLWLKGLPKLKPTNIVEGREGKVWRMPPSKDRWKKRSITYQGLADAMAEQWGNSDATLMSEKRPSENGDYQGEDSIHVNGIFK
jgi:site-specific DNA-cytosine methylase